jgi:hypothetical protein
MTITSNILRRDYTANGVNTSYAFDFPIFYESNATPKFSLEVIVADTTGAETTKIETTDYTITYNTTDYVNGVINQGNVVFNTAPANNYTISLLRKVNFTQNNDITTSGSDALPGTALEGSLDKLTLMLLEQKENLNRVFKLPKSSLLDNIEFPIGTSQANQVITVNNAGDNLTTKDLADVGLAPVSTFAKTLLDDTTASQARTTLDAQQLNSNLTFIANLPSAKATTTNQGVSYLNNPITIANNATDANNDIDFSAGNAPLDDGSGQVLLSSTLVKRLDASWVAGTNQGGLFSGTKAINTRYYEFAITNGTIIDAGFDISPTGANIPAGYKGSYRGMVLTNGSGNIIPFTLAGQYMSYVVEITDWTPITPLTDVYQTYPLSCPLKPNILAYIRMTMVYTGISVVQQGFFYRNTGQTTGGNFFGGGAINGYQAQNPTGFVPLNSLAQVDLAFGYAAPSTNFAIVTKGYFDFNIKI